MSNRKVFLFITSLFVLQVSFGQWSDISLENDSISLEGVSFLDNDRGIVVGTQAIYKTTDGGENWQATFEADSIVLHDIAYMSSDFSIAVGNNVDSRTAVVMRSTDDGDTWKMQEIQGIERLIAVYFFDNQVGYASGSDGAIIRTENGGDDWTTLDSGSSLNIESITFINQNVGIAVGGRVPSSNVILKTIDAGLTWMEVSSPADSNLNSSFFKDQDNGVVVGSNGLVLSTNDCGASWTIQTTVEMNGNLKVHFTDSRTGYIVGGQMNNTLILKTEDGGASWSPEGPNLNSGFMDLDFPAYGTGYFVGVRGSILKYETQSVTSIDESDIINDINLYPNPVVDFLNIEFSNNQSINSIIILNAQGQLIKSLQISDQYYKLDLSSADPGLYYIQISGVDQQRVRRFMKM